MLTFLKEYSRVLIKGGAPKFSAFKYFTRWKELVGKSPLEAKQPWISFEAIDFIEKRIRETDRVFEFGGGGSTLFFLSRAAEVVTVEHDREWFSMLKRSISPAEMMKWNGRLITAEQPVHTAGLNRAKPTDYFTDAPEFRDATFRSYATSIDQFEDGYFNLVLIDGRARTSCLYHSIMKVKVGGFLILDNSERPYYLENNSALVKDHYKIVSKYTGPVPYSAYFSQTTIWQRQK